MKLSPHLVNVKNGLTLHQTSPHHFLRKQLSVAAVTSQCGTGKRKDKRIDWSKVSPTDAACLTDRPYERVTP